MKKTGGNLRSSSRKSNIINRAASIRMVDIISEKINVNGKVHMYKTYPSK